MQEYAPPMVIFDGGWTAWPQTWLFFFLFPLPLGEFATPDLRIDDRFCLDQTNQVTAIYLRTRVQGIFFHRACGKLLPGETGLDIAFLKGGNSPVNDLRGLTPRSCVYQVGFKICVAPTTNFTSHAKSSMPRWLPKFPQKL